MCRVRRGVAPAKYPEQVEHYNSTPHGVLNLSTEERQAVERDDGEGYGYYDPREYDLRDDEICTLWVEQAQMVRQFVQHQPTPTGGVQPPLAPPKIDPAAVAQLLAQYTRAPQNPPAAPEAQMAVLTRDGPRRGVRGRTKPSPSVTKPLEDLTSESTEPAKDSEPSVENKKKKDKKKPVGANQELRKATVEEVEDEESLLQQVKLGEHPFKDVPTVEFARGPLQPKIPMAVRKEVPTVEPWEKSYELKAPIDTQKEQEIDRIMEKIWDTPA
ncbi:hypothetical protein B0H10DRAFT_1941627 [Mycena sp. CBHHK59/15]|nr:hypothetical protein B0H10DRAFT_1941627 [Mycena sp. CBHHK59/15]